MSTVSWYRSRAAAGWLAMLVCAGCTSTGEVAPGLHAMRRADYPVAIVAARFAPLVDVPLRLQSRLPDTLWGTFDGVLRCGETAAQLGDPGIAGAFALGCVTVGAVVGGVAGAVLAPPADTGTTLRLKAIDEMTERDPQRVLAAAVGDYLAEYAGGPVRRAGGAGPVSAEDLRVHTDPEVGSLLEVRLLHFVFSGGRERMPVCLSLGARARKLDARTGAVVDDLQVTRPVACRSIDVWTQAADKEIRDAVAAAYRRIAEDIVDELYLVYQPPQPTDAAPTSVVPDYVLAPIDPPPPEVYLDIDLLPKRGDLQGFGGLHFRDVASLTPSFAWAPLPGGMGPGADPADSPSDLSYEWRLTKGVRNGTVVAPGEPIAVALGLREPAHQVTTELEPCSWYYWSIRARFRLHGAWRVTEWSGAYHTAGGHYSPSASRRNVGKTFGFLWPADTLLLPFRTPASADRPDCWQEGA